MSDALSELDIGNHHFASGVRAQLGRELARLTPGTLTYSVFCASGSEANDVAIKTARRATGRRKIVALAAGYHGRTGLSGAAGEDASARYFLSDSPDFLTVPFGDLDAVEGHLRGGDVAAVLLETVPATYGFPQPPPGYLAGVRSLCDEYGALYIADEVQTGLGRSGMLWAVEAHGVEPDILVTGKGLSGGLYPIAAAVIRGRRRRLAARVRLGACLDLRRVRDRLPGGPRGARDHHPRRGDPPRAASHRPLCVRARAHQRVPAVPGRGPPVRVDHRPAHGPSGRRGLHATGAVRAWRLGDRVRLRPGGAPVQAGAPTRRRSTSTSSSSAWPTPSLKPRMSTGRFRGDTAPAPASGDRAQRDQPRRRASGWREPRSSATRVSPQADLTFVRHGENVTFRVDDRKRQFALRLGRPGYQTSAAIRSEIAWMDALREAGIATPRPVRASDGEVVQEVPFEGQLRVAVAFEWVDGVPLPETRATDPWARLGEIMARIHRHGREWTPPPGFERPAWNLDALVGDEPRWGSPCPEGIWPEAEREMLIQARDAVRRRLVAFGTEADRFGLVHADLGFENVLVAADRPTVIDFDDCGPGWYVYELASVLYPLRRRRALPGLRGCPRRRLPEVGRACETGRSPSCRPS